MNDLPLHRESEGPPGPPLYPGLHVEKRAGGDRRRSPAFSRDEGGDIRITPRGLGYAASLVGLAVACWAPMKSVWQLTELPAAVKELSSGVASLNGLLTKFDGRVTVVEKEVAGLQSLAPRVQQLEAKAAGYDAARSAADGVHDRQERRINTLEQERRRGGGS